MDRTLSVLSFNLIIKVLLFLIFTQEVNSFREGFFKMYKHFTFTGRELYMMPAMSKLSCTILCMVNDTCSGCLYEKVCFHMSRNQVKNLSFSESDSSLVKRNVFLRDLHYDPSTLETNHRLKLPKKFVVGDLIYMKAVLLKFDDVKMVIYEQPGELNTTYEFRARCGFSGCTEKFITINNQFNGEWNATQYYSLDYPLLINQTFELHVLVTTEGLVTYLNRVWRTTLNTILSVLNANYIHIFGNMQVLEFSL